MPCRASNAASLTIPSRFRRLRSLDPVMPRPKKTAAAPRAATSRKTSARVSVKTRAPKAVKVRAKVRAHKAAGARGAAPARVVLSELSTEAIAAELARRRSELPRLEQQAASLRGQLAALSEPRIQPGRDAQLRYSRSPALLAGAHDHLPPVPHPRLAAFFRQPRVAARQQQGRDRSDTEFGGFLKRVIHAFPAREAEAQMHGKRGFRH